MRKPLVSVILPTFNEAENIVPLISCIKKILGQYRYEILVIDDNSPDKTAQRVKKAFPNADKIKVRIRKKKHGLALSIKEGIDLATGDFIVVMDTDFNHDPAILPRFLTLGDSYDFVIGSRYVEGGGMENKTRYLFSMMYNKLITILLDLPTHDNLSGYFLLKRTCLQQLDRKSIFQGYGDYFIRLLNAARQNHLRMKEIPVFYKNRIMGRSKSNLIRMCIDYTKTVISLLP